MKTNKESSDNPLATQPSPETFEPLPAGQGFRFACHQAITCFTDCCRDLHLVLTPYDVLRMKRFLELDSTTFLDDYTFSETDPDWKVPVVKLKMLDNPERTCPYVVREGCRIYPDRPGACRAYPLGRAARQATHRFAPTVVQEEFFLVKEPHCKGFNEAKEWTEASWMADQGLAPFNEMNDLWMGFLTRYKPGSRELSAKQWQMFYMACYSLDRFREFVFGTRFLSLFSIPEEQIEGMRNSDEALLRFAYTWLAFSLFGDPVLKPVSP